MIKYGNLIECQACCKVGCDDYRATIVVSYCKISSSFLCNTCHWKVIAKYDKR